MLRDFVAIDVETANEELSSICSVGVVIVSHGQIVDTYYSLIHPEPEYFSYFNRRVHGLSAIDTDDAPIFPVVWEEVERHIAAVFPHAATVPFVAHNAPFDESCLRAAFKTYQLDYPDYLFYDTLAASRRQFRRSLPDHQLHTVAAACGYDLREHHHALEDAKACAVIALDLL